MSVKIINPVNPAFDFEAYSHVGVSLNALVLAFIAEGLGRRHSAGA